MRRRASPDQVLGTARLVGLLEMLLGKTEGATYLVRSVKQRPGNILSVGPVRHPDLFVYPGVQLRLHV